jgi:hypothetical protein
VVLVAKFFVPFGKKSKKSKTTLFAITFLKGKDEVFTKKAI